jgi:hypothetical protein
MIRPEPRTFAPVEPDEDLPEDVLHWAEVFRDAVAQKTHEPAEPLARH